MKETLLKTKIVPPRIPNYTLYRDRLLKLLKSNIDKRLISICADAGYGKTTLLAQFVKKLENPYIWYQVDKSDQDLALFMRYLVQGIKKYVPDFGKMTLSVINYSRKQETKIEMLVGTFINELLEIPEKRIVLLFDDLQEVYGAKNIIAGLDYLLKHMPTNVSIIVSARSNPPFSLERFQIKNETLSIDHEDLKFTKDEIKTLYKQISGYVPKAVELKKLEANSEGWITCLQFMVQPSKYRPSFAKSIKSLLNQLYYYFDKEIFSSLDEDLKSFLMVTSIFDYLLPEACDFLLSRKDSKQTIQELQKKHLFISTYDAPLPSYRYHHLFRSFLSKKLKESGRYRKFHNRAGVYWEKKGVPPTAMQHYCEAKNFKSLARIIEKRGEEYMDTGKSEIIKQYIDHIPENIINNSSNLILLKGRICARNYAWERATSYYLRARRIALRQRNHQEALKATYRRLAMNISIGEYKGIRKEVRKILCSEKLKSRRLRVQFLNILGGVFGFEGKIKNAISIFAEVLKLSKKIGDDYCINEALYNLSAANSAIGNFGRAQHYSELLTAHLRPTVSPNLPSALICLGNDLTMQGNLAEAEKILEEAQKFARLFNNSNKLCIILLYQAEAKIFERKMDEAKQLLNEAERMVLEIGHHRVLANIWDAMAAIAVNRGDFYKAKQHIDKALRLPIPPVGRASYLRFKGAIELSLGNLNTAKRALTQALPNLKESKHLLMAFYFHTARFYFLKKDTIKAKKFLYKAISLAEKNSYDFLLLYELKNYPEIVRFIKKIKLKSSYLQHLLLKLPYSETTDIVIEPEMAQYDFVVRLFDKVQIFKRKKEIKTGSWRTRRFQELFSFFVAHLLQTLTREKIIYTFWPDHRPEMAKQLFYNALYSIRKTIAKNIILFDKKGYALSAKYKYWVDTEEFEKLISKADRFVKDGNRAAGLIKYEEAASLYRGGFMDDFYSEWCQQRRRYFEGLYFYVLKNLAQGHYELGNVGKALRFCKLFIDKDPYYEEAHCIAMRCYAALNDLGGLQTCFSHLKQVLARGLKTTPHPETTKLFETLMKQRNSKSQ